MNSITVSLSDKKPQPAAKKAIPVASRPQVSKSPHSPNKTESVTSRLSSLRPIDKLIVKPGKSTNVKAVKLETQFSPYEVKRKALAELYYAGCSKCNLSQTRAKLVFGAGNADAAVMVIGDVPEVGDDVQGKPLVGAAGQKLTQMLSAINLDREKDIFVTNVLKCRPPQDRQPENSEILACMSLLNKQISIIEPKAILILGSVAAQVLLGNNDSIEKLCSKVHDYNGIPAMVIYHPAELLLNSGYKRQAWEDLQKFQTLIEKFGIHGLSK